MLFYSGQFVDNKFIQFTRIHSFIQFRLSVHPFVCLSETLRYYVKTVKHIVEIHSPPPLSSSLYIFSM